jgi:hypothetical protein
MFLRFATVSELRRFYFGVAYITVIFDVYKVEIVRFNIAVNLFPYLQ